MPNRRLRPAADIINWEIVFLRLQQMNIEIGSNAHTRERYVKHFISAVVVKPVGQFV